MNAFLRSVSMLSLLRMTVEMLLPEGNTRRLCDTILGLAAMMCVLTALKQLLFGWIG